MSEKRYVVLVQDGVATSAAATNVTRGEAWGVARRMRAEESHAKVAIMLLEDQPICVVDFDQPLD